MFKTKVLEQLSDNLRLISALFQNTLFFMIASWLTTRIPSDYNLLIVIFTVVVATSIGAGLQALLGEASKSDTIYTAPTAIAAFMTGTIVNLMTQFVGTTLARYMTVVLPADEDFFHDVMPKTLLILACVGLALRVYT
jgi:hypothetical protein